jgi:DNA repair protein RadC
VKGHQLVTIGTMDTMLVHPREVFRVAVVGCAAAIVLMHNHPSGDQTPSEADIKVTRDLIRAGQLLKIEVLDHVIMGNPKHSSLRELVVFTTDLATVLADSHLALRARFFLQNPSQFKGI